MNLTLVLSTKIPGVGRKSTLIKALYRGGWREVSPRRKKGSEAWAGTGIGAKERVGPVGSTSFLPPTSPTTYFLCSLVQTGEVGMPKAGERWREGPGIGAGVSGAGLAPL